MAGSRLRALETILEHLNELSPEARWGLALENQRVMEVGRPAAPELDRYAEAGAEALAVLLRPWLEGDRALDYDVAEAVLDWLRGGGGEFRREQVRRRAARFMAGGPDEGDEGDETA